MTENEGVADGDEGTSASTDGPADDRGDAADGDGTDGAVDAGSDDAGVDEDGADDAQPGEAESNDAESDETEPDETEPDETDATEEEGDEHEEQDEHQAEDERDELVERVAEADPEELADEIAELRDSVETLEAERDDLESRLKRKQAEFQNYKKRREKRREEERQRATEDLVERLLDVRDNLRRALETDEDADIRGGVETTLRQFDRVLDAENVERIDPEPGDEVDPQRHEVLMRVESDREPGTVDELHRPGYEMAGKLLRAAQVTVAEEPDG